MIAHVAIRRTKINASDWLHAYGWVLGASVGAGTGTSRLDTVMRACIEALSSGAAGLAMPDLRDWSALSALDADRMPAAIEELPSCVKVTHSDPAAVAVAQRAASVELMRECVRRRGAPDLLGEAAGAIDALGGPETVASVLGCDPAQVVRWRKAGRLPGVRVEALKRELEAMA